MSEIATGVTHAHYAGGDFSDINPFWNENLVKNYPEIALLPADHQLEQELILLHHQLVQQEIIMQKLTIMVV